MSGKRKGKSKTKKKDAAEQKTNGATLGFERKLWAAADKLRNNLDAAEYKHVVLGLIFLKYISDAFQEKHAELEAERAQGADPEDPDEYRAENIFWVPKEARWSFLQNKAKEPEIGKLVDDAMVAIERDNKSPKGVLPKDYARPALDKQRLGELIDLIGTIGLGQAESRSRDVLGRRRHAQGHCPRARRGRPQQRHHRLDRQGVRPRQDARDGPSHSAQARLPARQAGAGDADRARAGRAAGRGMGGVRRNRTQS